MPAPAATRITELDFDALKANLVSFFSSQDYFKDYNFTASGLDALVNQLAYTVIYPAFYGNMLAAEAIPDSASLRSTVTSHAKTFGYVTKSPTASTAVITVLATPSGGPGTSNQTTIAKGTTFPGYQGANTPGSVAKTFTATQSWQSVVGAGNTQTFSNIEIREGTYGVFDYVVDLSDVEQRFLVPTANADTSLLEVYVQEGTDDTTMVQYTLGDDITTYDSTSEIYFIQEVETGQFQVYFGDGVFGKAVTSGKIVRLVYFQTSGSAGNDYSVFNLSASTIFTGSLSGYATNCTTITKSYSGEDAETVDEIKFNAPRAFSTRKRGLTDDDWRSVMLGNFSDIRDAKVWGGQVDPNGEDGFIYISVDPKQGSVLTQNRKDQIEQLLMTTYRVEGLTPTLVDPDFVYFIISARCTLDDTLSRIDVPSIKNNARAAMATYSTTNLEKFSGNYYNSILEAQVNGADPAILDTDAAVLAQCRLSVSVGGAVAYTANFSTPIVPGSLTSTPFTSGGRVLLVQDDGKGNLQTYLSVGSTNVLVNATAGTVDYVNGIASLLPISIQLGDPATKDLRISATPTQKAITASFNKIFVIDDAASKITAVVGNRVYP